MFKRALRKAIRIAHSDWTLQRRSHDMLWVVQAYVMETMPQAYRSSMHFLELYGFFATHAWLSSSWPYFRGARNGKYHSVAVLSSPMASGRPPA
ncbi:MAG: hypothetical protein U0936_16850 [Planctomycetaceae bacterium]